MTRRNLFALLATAVTVWLTVQPAMAQAQTATDGNWAVPRRADGRPDLQGVWDFRTITPLQRPEELAGQQLLTDENEATLVERALERQIDRPPPPGGVGGYNQFWMDRGTNVVEDRRTSLIVDPPDGRLPPLTPNAFQQEGSLNSDLGKSAAGPLSDVGPRGHPERKWSTTRGSCRSTVGRICQTPFASGRGISRGRWEGDTLIVETTNFTDKTASFGDVITTAYGTGTTLHLTERFSRIAEDTLLYQYTVTDPVTFMRPFTVEIPMRRGNAIFEYACHEGNYGMLDILAGARAREQARQAGGSR